MRLLFSALLSILFAYPCFSETVELQPITINKLNPVIYGPNKDILIADDISRLPLFSLEKIIDYSSAVEVRQRAPWGTQQDISLRGAGFEDTRLAIEGIDISDPQTGHYTMEIPFTSADLEEIDIHKNARMINLRLARPKDRGGVLASSFGEHALFEQLLSVNFGLMGIKNRLSMEHRSSKGDRHDTDFEIYNFSFHSLWENESNEAELLFGSTEKDFGADSFYSSFFSQEEEHISQRFFLLRSGLKKSDFKLDNTFFFRRHGDKFILNRHNPEFYTNYHTTYVYGLKSRVDFKNGFFVSSRIKKEKITSTSLDNHSHTGRGVSLGLNNRRTGNFLFDFEAGFDYYRKWDYLEKLHLGVGYDLRDDLKLQFTFDRLCRNPSFTELYYISPANLGNPGLEVQKTDNFEIGLDYFPKNYADFSLNFFLNRQFDTIDWVKEKAPDPWQAKNVGDLKTFGLDFSSRIRFKHGFLKRICLDYTYLALDEDKPYNFSKYAFDYNRHKLISIFSMDIKGVSFNLIGNFSRPLERHSFNTLDLKIVKNFPRLSVSLEGTNIFNEGYQEMQDIDGTGRWIKLSFSHYF